MSNSWKIYKSFLLIKYLLLTFHFTNFFTNIIIFYRINILWIFLICLNKIIYIIAPERLDEGHAIKVTESDGSATIKVTVGYPQGEQSELDVDVALMVYRASDYEEGNPPIDQLTTKTITGILKGDSRPVTLHMLISASIVFILLTTMLGDFHLPNTVTGWWAISSGPLFYAFAIISLFIAIAILGPIKASMTMNLEPVSSILLGFLILNQSLTNQQILGSAIVIISILLIQQSNKKKI